jgi:trehalose synthase
MRRDGAPAELRRYRDLLNGSAPPSAEAPLVVQVSRWDRLKDMAGVLSAFAEHLGPARGDAHLMLVGPDVSGVSDDPEGADVLATCRDAWKQMPGPTRARCHLVSVPMDDVDENAIIINAMQRHAAIVVQKSFVEGSGLPSPRQCGKVVRSSPVQWAASKTRSSTAATGCCSQTLTTCPVLPTGYTCC